MNDLIVFAKMWLTEERLSLHETGFKLNEMPMSAIKYASPRKAMCSIVTD